MAKGGVDLNRNYDVNFGTSNKPDRDKFECGSDTYTGPQPFSEPETQAMRDFFIKNKNSLSFIYNLHCAGNQYIFPYNTDKVNSAYTKLPKTMALFSEIVSEAEFPDSF